MDITCNLSGDTLVSVPDQNERRYVKQLPMGTNCNSLKNFSKGVEKKGTPILRHGVDVVFSNVIKERSLVEGNCSYLNDVVKSSRLIQESGVPNCIGCHIPVSSALNISFKFREYLSDYTDKEICEFLEFGWPVGYEGNGLLIPSLINHKGAINDPEGVERYLKKEISYGSVIGPLSENPFTHTALMTSPLQAVSKKDSDEKRIVVDLSFPQGYSVNDGISKTSYLGKTFNITYPSVDEVIARGRHRLLSKRDLKRAYRQLPVDPGDIPLLGYSWQGNLYVDKVLPMGLHQQPWYAKD